VSSVRGLDSGLRLLLEGVQDIARHRKLHRVDRPEGVAHMVGNDLEHSRPTEALERFGAAMLQADLLPGVQLLLLLSLPLPRANADR